MSGRSELILRALRQRYDEVCQERIAKLNESEFGEHGAFVAEIRQHLAASPAGPIPATAIETWSSSFSDCFFGLKTLVLGKSLELRLAPDNEAADSFLKTLHNARNEPNRVVGLTCDRYACPVNFLLPSEKPVREYLLQRLMVQFRAKIERAQIRAEEAEAALLKLNLISLAAARNDDLRFIDALNYYYELLTTDRQPHFQDNWLLVSYLALYAQALAAWCREDK